MKKLLGIIVLGLLWCNVGFALTQEEAKDEYLKNRKLDSIEGIWMDHQGDTFTIYKEGNSYIGIVIEDEDLNTGRPAIYLTRSTKNIYKGNQDWPWIGGGVVNGKVIYSVYGNSASVTYSARGQTVDRTFRRLWPQDTNSHNAQLEEKKEPTQPSPDDNKVVPAGSGSGFFVSSEGHIITNHHVIDGCNTTKVNFKGNQIDTQILAVDKANDIAILITNIKPERIFSVSNNDVSLLDDIIVAGFPLTKISSAIKTSKGVVTALAGSGDNYSEFQTDTVINAGNSGGPIINQKGNVVGIAVSSWIEEGVEGFHFGIKSSTLRTFANSNSLKLTQANNIELSNKDLGKLIIEATVYLECHMTVADIKKMMAAENNQKAFFSEFK